MNKSILAIILIAIGIVSFVYQGIAYTSQEKVLDLGALEMTTKKSHWIPFPPIIGAIFVTGGIAIFVVQGRKARA